MSLLLHATLFCCGVPLEPVVVAIEEQQVNMAAGIVFWYVRTGPWGTKILASVVNRFLPMQPLLVHLSEPLSYCILLSTWNLPMLVVMLSFFWVATECNGCNLK